MGNGVKLDQIGYWSEVKLDIVRRYAGEYSKILSVQQQRIPRFRHVYIDAFSGAGMHLTKNSNMLVPGSPYRALEVEPAFSEYHFIDMDSAKLDVLRQCPLVRGRNVHFHHGNCNKILLEQVLPTIDFGQYRRALCFLDPYAINLDWRVIEMAGKLGTVDIVLNFMIMDMNMNVFLRPPKKPRPEQAERMTLFWGDESWRHVAAQKAAQMGLFGDIEEKSSNEEVAEAFRRRLQDVAHFAHVPNPLAMRQSTGATVYYLYIASQKDAGRKIASHIFAKYQNRFLPDRIAEER